MKYRIPVHMLPQLKEFVTDMLEKNFIVPNPGSTFSSPMLVLAKPRNADGTSRGFRLVTDFRSLNKCIDAPQFWQQDIGLAQEKLRGAKYLSTLDMRDGYWNAGVDKASQDLGLSKPTGLNGRVLGRSQQPLVSLPRYSLARITSGLLSLNRERGISGAAICLTSATGCRVVTSHNLELLELASWGLDIGIRHVGRKMSSNGSRSPG
jgi:hypothetical protein